MAEEVSIDKEVIWQKYKDADRKGKKLLEDMYGYENCVDPFRETRNERYLTVGQLREQTKDLPDDMAVFYDFDGGRRRPEPGRTEVKVLYKRKDEGYYGKELFGLKVFVLSDSVPLI